MSLNAHKTNGQPAQKDWIAGQLQSLRESLALCGDLIDEQLPAHAALELHSLALNAGNFARFLGINALNSVRNGLEKESEESPTCPVCKKALKVTKRSAPFWGCDCKVAFPGDEVIHADTAAS